MKRPGLWNAYRIPILLAALSLVGLVSALIEDGMFDIVSWVLLGAIVLAMAPALMQWPRNPPGRVRSKTVESEAGAIERQA
jgi:hypothetical protein